MYKQQVRLEQCQLRLINRQEIFNINRRLQAQRQKQEDALTLINMFKDNDDKLMGQKYYIDDKFRTIIAAFQRQKYHIKSIKYLVKSLQDQNIFNIYRVLIGIYNFGKQMINNENFLDIYGSGIIKNLSSIFLLVQHPFLQIKACSVMSRLLQRIDSQRFPIYFNKTTVPVNNVLFLLRQQSSFDLNMAALNMCTHLIKQTYPMTALHYKILLQFMMKIFYKLKNLNEKEGIKWQFKILKNIKFNINRNEIDFINEYYHLLQKLFVYAKDHNDVQSMKNIIAEIYYNRIGVILKFLKRYGIKTADEARVKAFWIYRIVYRVIRLQFLKPNDYSYSQQYNSILSGLKSNIFNAQESSIFISERDYLLTIQRQLSQMNENKNKNDIKGVIINILQMLSSLLIIKKNLNIKQIVDNYSLLYKIRKFYDEDVKEYNRKINEIVSTLIYKGCHQIWTKIIEDNLIDLYFMATLKMKNKTFMKSSLSNMVRSIHQHKKLMAVSGTFSKIIKVIYNEHNQNILKEIQMNYNYVGLQATLKEFERIFKQFQQENKNGQIQQQLCRYISNATTLSNFDEKIN